jgi:glutamine cyclotransferase
MISKTMEHGKVAGTPAGRMIRRRYVRIGVVALSVIAAAAGTALVFADSHGERTTKDNVVATLRVQGRPNSIVAGTDALWVSLNFGQDQRFARLDRLDLATGKTEASVRLSGVLGGNSVRIGNSVWVGHNEDWLDTKPGELTEVAWSSGRLLGSVRFDKPVFGIAAGGGSLWALVGRSPATLVRIDPASRQVLGRAIPVSNGRALGLAYTDGYLWATVFDTGTLERIDPRTGSIDRVRVGDGPVGLVVVSGSVWVANRGSGTVSRIDRSTVRVLGKPIHVGNLPTYITAAAGSVWVSDQQDGTVIRIDARTGEQRGAAIRVAAATTAQDWAAAHALSGGPDGSVWVSSMTEQTVSRIDPSR